MRLAVAALLAVALVTEAAGGPDIRQEDLAYTYGIGTFDPVFAPPPPGTYALPVIDEVADHPLVDSDGRRTSLHALTDNRLAVVAFIYTRCAEATGCPISALLLHRIDQALARDDELRGHVTLLTVSFDPERDTPSHLAETRRLHAPASDWRFATTRDTTELQPLLDDFGQPVSRLDYTDGRWTGFYRHVLKVFLLDGRHRVRNVYSTGFLHPDLVLNDLRTLRRGG